MKKIFTTKQVFKQPKKRKLNALFTFILFLCFFATNKSIAQVGIGTATPNSSAQLEIQSNDKGLLIPQVALQSTTDAVTIVNGNVSGLTVFNTSTTGDVTPGYYFWYNNQWRRILSENILSTLVDNNNGTYTYTNENGFTTLVNVVQDMYDYGDTLLSNATFMDSLSNTIMNNNTFINNISSDTTFANSLIQNQFFTQNLANDSNFIANLTVNQQFIDSINQLILDGETVTTIVDNNNGTYTYTNEDAVTSLVNVVQDIYDFGDTLLSNSTFMNNLSNTITNNTTFITNLGSDSTFISNLTVNQQFVDSINQLILDGETVTTLVENNNGTYTYTNEDAVTSLINVVQYIYDFGDTLLSNTTFMNNLSNTITNNPTFITNLGSDSTFVSNLTVNQQFIDSIYQIILAGETNTTLVDNGNGTFTFTNEDGVVSIINFLKSASNGLSTVSGEVKLGGALTQPTTISAISETNRLIFNGTGIDAINFASNTLSIDATNNRIGIGTTTPEQSLTIAGTNALGVDNSTFFRAKNSFGNYETFLHPRWSDDVMYLNFGTNGFNIRNNSSTNVMFMSDNGFVGIGTTTPTTNLDVNGQIKISGGVPGLGKVLTSDATGLATWETPIITTIPTEPWKVEGTGADATLNTQNIYQLGNIGIGTTTPTATLDIAGDIKISGGSPGAGKVLTSDVNGLATWQGVTVLEETRAEGAAALNFDVDETGETQVPNSSISFTIPDGGRAVTINYSLGFKFTGAPILSDGESEFTVYMYIDGVKSGIREVYRQPNTNAGGGYYHFSCIKNLSAGAHVIRFNILRTQGNILLPAGSGHNCRILNYYKNVSFSN